jgi:hypothetical protein
VGRTHGVGVGSLVTRTALPFTAILVLDASPLDMALLSVMDLVAGWLRLELLYVIALVAGALDTIFEVAQGAYVPTLVAPGALVAANAHLSASASSAEMAAFAAGGWLVQWLGPPVLGRAHAAKRVLDTVAMLAGALAGGVLGDALGLRWALAVAGLVPLGTALGCARTMARRTAGN